MQIVDDSNHLWQRVKSELDGGHMVDDARDPCDDPEIRAMVSSW